MHNSPNYLLSPSSFVCIICLRTISPLEVGGNVSVIGGWSKVTPPLEGIGSFLSIARLCNMDVATMIAGTTSDLI